MNMVKGFAKSDATSASLVPQTIARLTATSWSRNSREARSHPRQTPRPLPRPAKAHSRLANWTPGLLIGDKYQPIRVRFP
jgi:hypothetical protein